MTDITDPRLIKLKGIVLLAVGLLAAALLILEHVDPETLAPKPVNEPGLLLAKGPNGD